MTPFYSVSIFVDTKELTNKRNFKKKIELEAETGWFWKIPVLSDGRFRGFIASVLFYVLRFVISFWARLAEWSQQNAPKPEAGSKDRSGKF